MARDLVIFVTADGNIRKVYVKRLDNRSHGHLEPAAVVVHGERSAFGGKRAVANFLPGRKGQQIVSFSSRMDTGEGQGYCFTFDKGVEKGELAWTTGPLTGQYSPMVIVDDVDGDQLPEIVTAPHYCVQIFSGQTGELKAEIPVAKRRNYGILLSRQRRDRPQKDIYIVCDFVLHLECVRFENGRWIHAWGHKYLEDENAPNPQGRQKYIRVSPNPVSDLDGDGCNEVVVQNAAGEITALRVVDSGGNVETLWSVPGVAMNMSPGYSWNGALRPQAADVDGDGLPEVFFAREDEHGMSALVCVDGQGKIKWTCSVEACPWGGLQAGVDHWTFGRFTRRKVGQDVYDCRSSVSVAVVFWTALWTDPGWNMMIVMSSFAANRFSFTGKMPSRHDAASEFHNRRDFLRGLGQGFGGLALAAMLHEEGLSAPGTQTVGAGAKLPVVHHPAKAKRVVQLFMSGAASHLDTFDYKPALERHHGQDSDFGEHVEAFQNGLGPWLKSPWKFQPYGECGKYLSEIVAPLGSCVDDIAFIHSMAGKTGVHSQATYLQATGFQLPGFPGMGSWISYALGSLNENLPTFVVMPDHRGFASNGTKNWSSAFLPGQHQGTIIRPGTKNPIRDLFPGENSYITHRSEEGALSLLNELNRRHERARPGDARLEARIRSYELAAKMQLTAPEALDISREPSYILKMYGLNHGKATFDTEINAIEETDYFGRKCLAARRLLERGVRFVQIWSGNDNAFPRRNWDSHEDIRRDHGPLARGMSHGTAALIKDLKQRGLLDDTVVLWTTEFGRMPSSQGGTGRDHNPFAFTNWLAGGGIQGGVTYGPSDQWGYKPLDRDNPTYVYDVHATILHLLGIDHEQLTVRHNGIDRRLTDVHGRVIHEILA